MACADGQAQKRKKATVPPGKLPDETIAFDFQVSNLPAKARTLLTRGGHHPYRVTRIVSRTKIVPIAHYIGAGGNLAI
jgi:hypothetical protein